MQTTQSQAPEPSQNETIEVQAEKAVRSYSKVRRRIMNSLERGRVRGKARSALLLLPDFLALMIRLLRDKRVGSGLKVQLLVAISYVISPLDIIPDFTLGIGFLDDVIAAATILTQVVGILGQAGEEVLQEHWDGDSDVLVQIRTFSAKFGNILRPGMIARVQRKVKTPKA
jgi:uncharacterized membrane protein YkvA (DUF1232 family)